MAKPKKKKSSAKKSTARKARPALKPLKPRRKVSAKRSASKKAVRVSTKAVKRSPKVSKSRKAITGSPAALFGRNNRERRLDPFTRNQKERFPQLPNAMVDSRRGPAQDTPHSRPEGTQASPSGTH